MNITKLLKNGESETVEFKESFDREAVINAICHRDYSDTADIQIKIFDDHFQVWSPGSLPFGLTKALLVKTGTTGRGTYYTLIKAQKPH